MSDKPLFKGIDEKEAVYAPEHRPETEAEASDAAGDEAQVWDDEMPVAPHVMGATAGRGTGLIGGVGAKVPDPDRLKDGDAAAPS